LSKKLNFSHTISTLFELHYFILTINIEELLICLNC
jgi:hypothetical protein